MKTLANLDGPVLALSGEEVVDGDGKPLQVGKLIANAIARGQAKGQEIRAMDLALRIFNANDSIQLDDADITLAQEMVGADQLLSNLAKAASLRVLEGVEDGVGEQ